MVKSFFLFNFKQESIFFIHFLISTEGFASFMEFLAVDNLFPEYKIWEQFTTDTLTSALQLDSLHNSHPIEVPVSRANEIEEIFDDISYAK